MVTILFTMDSSFPIVELRILGTSSTIKGISLVLLYTSQNSFLVELVKTLSQTVAGKKCAMTSARKIGSGISRHRILSDCSGPKREAVKQ